MFFFHDINNLLGGVSGASELLKMSEDANWRVAADLMQDSVQRMIQEMMAHQTLVRDQISSYKSFYKNVSVAQLVDEIGRGFQNQICAQEKRLVPGKPLADCVIYSDETLICRVLNSMLANAFEATEIGGEVRFWAEIRDQWLVFNVWNCCGMPPERAMRIFQRYFTTKQETGRGYGTYSMKFFGEKLLRGKVDFSSSNLEGTTFRLWLPMQAPNSSTTPS